MKRSVFLFTFFVFGLAGCTTLGLGKATEKNFRYIKVGQAAHEVTQQIGSPDSRTPEKNGEVWSYQILRSTRRSADPYKLFFVNGILRDIRFDSTAAKIDADLKESRAKPGNDQPGQCVPILDNSGHDTDAKSCDGSAPIR
jgi:hypothetical protein